MRKAALTACLLALTLHGFVHAQQASVNTPVLPGAPTNPADPTPLLTSDFVRQRQVEPDLIVSTRNPQHLMAVFNDYRAVDIAADGFSNNQYSNTGFKAAFGRMLAWLTGRPAPKGQLPKHAAAVEASVGMARSSDGGLTWTGAMVPGSPDDHSPASLSSPIYGLDAMTDPRGAAGPCGYAYVVLVSFSRGGESRIAVARWQDRNNKDGSEAWHYQGTSVVEVGLNSTNGQFHDLPSIVVDPLRISNGDPCAHNIYIGWARFNGASNASVLNFARATAGSAAVWAPSWATRFVGSTDKTNQAATVAVDPRPGAPGTTGGGTVYYGWRTFKSNNSPDRYWVARSTNFGDTFEKSVLVTGTSPVYPYDQPSLSSDLAGPQQLAFRSNALPTVEVVPNAAENPTGSTVYMAWQERVNMASCPGGAECGLPDPMGEPRVVLTRSTDGGKVWSSRRAVDIGNRDINPPAAGLGYLPQFRQSGGQLMPRLSFGGGRLALLYYESRGPLTVVPGYGTVLAGLDRHLDARLALLDLADGHMIGTAQVSRYLLKPFTDLSNGETVEDVAEAAPGVPAINARVNVPNSGGGRIPFIGDYIGVTPIVRLVPGTPGGPWRWAISPSDVPFQGFRTVFADSRNQIPPLGTPEQQVAQYPFYSPAKQNEPSCVNPGSRNHDVMYALVNASVTLNAATTFKQNNVERAFPITVGNPAEVKKFYQVTLDRPDIASWTQSIDANPEHSVQNFELFPFASATRNVYISAATATESVKVTVRELQVGGAQCTGDSQTLENPLCTLTVLPTVLGSMTLNLDPTNPPYEAGDEATSSETHDPTLSDPVTTTPFVSNPFVSNPFVSNPFVSNPFVSNPFVSNPFVSNATVYDITDLTWTVDNSGNTTSSYVSRLNLGDLDQMTGNYAFQLLIYKKAYYAGITNCEPVNIPFDQLISSVPNPFVSNVQVSNPFVSNPFVSNPFVSNPFVSNATFAEAPPSGGTGDFHDGTRHDYRADQVLVTLRAYQLKPTAQLTAKFDPVDNPPSFAVHSHARNVVNGKKQQGPPPFAIKGSDLVASGVFPAASVTAGFTIPVPQATVTNSGNLKSGTFRYGYYLSTDAVIDPKQDVLLAAGTVQPKLDPGQTNTAGPADVTIPSTVAAGSYFYGIAFDDTGHVGETDETNNFVSAPLIVASLGTVDQQQPLIDAAAPRLSIGGATAQKAAQEVTAGVTRALTNVLLPVSCSSDATLTLQIQGVTNRGFPNGVVLSSTTFAGGSTSGAGGGFFDYPLAAPVPMTAGQKFSIVLTGTATGSCTIAQGPVSDPYKPGAAFSDSLSVTPGVWDALPAKRDFPFKTLVK